MGISLSTNNELLSKDLGEQINRLLTHLLTQHMDNFLDKSFCEKTKLFYKDNVFMKHAEEDIKILGKNILIGKEINKISEKREICDKLSKYYLKKLNLVSSIYFIINYSLSILEKIERGPICIGKNKKDISSEKYNSHFEESQVIHFNNKKIKIPSDLSINIISDDLRKRSYDKYLTGLGKKKNYLPDEVKSYYLITELNNKKCKLNNFIWTTKKEDLIKNNIIPSDKVNKFNKSYNNIISKNRLKINDYISKLLNYLNEVVEEKINKEKKKEYIDKPISYDKINIIIKNVKDNIENILIQLNITIFQLSNQYFISEEEILTKNELENKINNSN